MFTICYWDNEEATWVGHRRFTNLSTAVGQSARGYVGPTIVVGKGGRILHGSAVVQRVPDGF